MCVEGEEGVVGVTLACFSPDRLRTAPKLVSPPATSPPKQQQLPKERQPLKKKQRLPWPGITHMVSVDLLQSI